MIIDHLSNHSLYTAISPLISKTFNHLLATDLAALTPGHHDIDGSDLYVMISEYTTRPALQEKGESHRCYIDVHYMINGTERIGWAPLSCMTAGEFVPQKDFLPVTGGYEFLTLVAGDFMVLWPHDAHMPGIAAEAGPLAVKKAVYKVRVK